jgi:hypothetical protein
LGGVNAPAVDEPTPSAHTAIATAIQILAPRRRRSVIANGDRRDVNV